MFPQPALVLCVLPPTPMCIAGPTRGTYGPEPFLQGSQSFIGLLVVLLQVPINGFDNA
jgi:hypothetical protein